MPPYKTGLTLMSSFTYTPLLPYGPDETDYELVTAEHVTQIDIDGQAFIKVAPEGLRLLSERAFKDISHLLRPSHLGQLRAILDDPEATKNDRFVALEMLKNAVVASDLSLIHISEPTRLRCISYAVFCLKKKK